MVISLMAASFNGCDFVYRVLQREGAEEKELIGEVVPFEANAKVLELQKLLKLYGYPIGNPDGQLGPNTRKAIAMFQEDQGIKVSRFVDYITWDRLNMFVDSGLIIKGDVNTWAVQKALRNAGFNPGPIDGKYGAGTDKALRSFQKAMGLTPDGKIGFRTLRELHDFLPAE